MGFNIGLIAVRGKPVEDLHSLLQLRPTGATESEPESPVVGAQLPSGWYVIYYNDRSPPGADQLVQLSTGAEVLSVDIAETVMSSSAALWRDRIQQWGIAHDCQRGKADLEVIGEPPNCYQTVFERLRNLQTERDDADYLFDVPVEVVHELTGFRYDGNPDGYPVDTFVILERLKSPRKWWRFWDE